LTELINAKRNGKTIGAKPRPKGENVVDLMDALRKSIGSETSPNGKKPRKASASQKEMLLPIEGKGRAEKKAAKPQQRTRARTWDPMIKRKRAPRFFSMLAVHQLDWESRAREARRISSNAGSWPKTWCGPWCDGY
jgi:hypothetical protein